MRPATVSNRDSQCSHTAHVAMGRTHRRRRWPMSHKGHSRRGGRATSTKPADETATTPPLHAHRRGLHDTVPSTHPQGSQQCKKCVMYQAALLVSMAGVPQESSFKYQERGAQADTPSAKGSMVQNFAHFQQYSPPGNLRCRDQKLPAQYAPDSTGRSTGSSFTCSRLHPLQATRNKTISVSNRAKMT